MKLSGTILKVLPVACAAGILLAAGVMCQKPKSAQKETAKASVADTAAAAVKAMEMVDTSVKKTTVKTGAATVVKAAATGYYYTCHMHPKVRQAKPGKCPVCKMDLVIKKADKTTER